MTPSLLTRVRQKRALSQVGLAQLAGISRQSLHQIEHARSVPGVDVALRLARALDCSVEELFGEQPEITLRTELYGKYSTSRVAVAQVGGRFISYPLTAAQHALRADALIADTEVGDEKQLDVRLLVPHADIEQHLVLQGCSPALGLLANYYTYSSRTGRALWLVGSNADALAALSDQKIHVAALHGPETADGHPAPSRRHKLAHRSVCLAHWQLGLLCRKQPKASILGVGDLCRKGLRIANRAAGARAQQLLEQQLKQSGLPVALGRVSTLQMSSHLTMAEAIALNRADVGVASLDSALLYDLHFVPLAHERIDLVCASHAQDNPALQRLFQLVTEAPMRKELESLGYETTHTGQTQLRETL